MSSRILVTFLVFGTGACGMVRVNGAPLESAKSAATPPVASAASPSPAVTTASASAPAPSAAAPAAPPVDKGKKAFADHARSTAARSSGYLDFVQGDYDLVAYQAQLEREGTPVDGAWAAELVEKEHARIQTAITDGAAKHEGWTGTVAAPPAAAKVATDQVRNHPYLRAREHFHFLAVQILDDSKWLIERSRAGIPLAEFKRVVVVARRDGIDGGCFGFDATINHTNLGGSTYASEWGSVTNLSSWSPVKCPAGAR